MGECTYLVAVLNSGGTPNMLYGPFPTEQAATDWIAEWDEVLGDLENDIATEELTANPNAVTEVETVVMMVNPIDQFTKGSKP